MVTMPWKNRVSTISPDRCVVAWDIETVPLPEPQLTSTHQERIEKETRILLDRQNDLDDAQAQRLAQSTHSLTGRICCISAVAGTLSDGHRDPVSFTAASLEDEPAMLERFWDKISGFNCEPVWVTFNGKKFDVPFLLARSARHEIERTRDDLVDTYPYSFDPHADLYGAFQPCRYTLEDMCTLLGVDPSKADFDGSQVAEAVADGRIDEVAAYCERDVEATWRCYARMHSYLS
jgi:hypothetical protein